MKQYRALLSTAVVAAVLLTSCSAGESNNSSAESSSSSTSLAATSTNSPSSGSSTEGTASPSSTGASGGQTASNGNMSSLLTAVESVENLSNGAVRKFSASGSITDFNQNQVLILNNKSSVSYVAKVSLDSGAEEQKIDISDAEVPEGYQLIQILDAAFVGDSIVLRYEANEGADKYNSGELINAVAQFSADGKQVGKTIFTRDNPLSPSYGNAPWVAGVPGESIVLTVPTELNFSDGAAQGNVAIFEGGKEPRLQTLQEPEFSQPHGLVDGTLVALSSESQVPGMVASTQVGEDSYITLKKLTHFLVNQANYADPSSGSELPIPRNRTSLAQPDYVNGYWCDQAGKVYDLTTGESLDYGDVVCDAVTEDGTVLGRKGSKSLPVIITKDGTIIDLPSEIRGAGFISSKYFISGSEIYQYSIEK
ncbi:hypothetical protein [Rothia nasimurium]|uniref:hypothetical protein n=2 Tax=Rothia nasimurium TaxID=85336 RepID=UPI001F32FF0F|nr:hypothetical protein [Rothia nasimurium]